MARSNVPNILGRGRGNGVTDASLTRRRVAAGRGSLGLALAVSCVALAACGGSSSRSSSAGGKTGVVNAKPGGSLTVLLNSGYEGAWPTGLDPATNTNGAANQDLMNSIYGNLFELGAGGIPLARFVTEESENTFPRLPVREDEHIYAFFAGYPSREQHTAQQRRDEIERATARAAPLKNSPVMLRLLPTRRSLLTGAAPETSSTHARDD